MLAYLGKILLFVAGLVIVLDVIKPKWLKDRARAARKDLAGLLAQRRLTRAAGPIEKAAEAMARHAARHKQLPAADLANGYLTKEEFTSWVDDARARLIAGGCDPDELPDANLNRLEQWAREFLLRNERIPEKQRTGLKIVNDDLAQRGWRHWKMGVMLLGLTPPVAVVVLCVSGQRNPVSLGFAFLLTGGVALYIWGGLLVPSVLRQFRRAAAMRQALLARSAWRLLVAAQDRKVFTWCALTAYLAGSLLDLATSLP
jgi:hypothetical protein